MTPPIEPDSPGLSPARVAFDEAGLAHAPDYGDVYHPAAGAFAQARHVFLAGNGLPGRWRARARFVVLETGFGLGHNFLATWAAWRADPARCERLVFMSVEKHPLSPQDLRRAHRDSEEPALAAQLVAAWPRATPDLHLLDFEDGRVQLMLAFGDARPTLAGLQAEVDAFFLDGFAPSRNAAMWSPDVFRQVGRLAAPGATAATWSAARAVRDGLAAQGFEVERAPGSGGKRDITVARHAPRHRPAPPAAWRPAHAGPREALVIGAGLAGASAAWALARQGWASTVLDRRPTPAAETSGNPGGLMHAIFNAPDSLHARWFRAAAGLTARLAAPALADGSVAGQLDGLVRLEPRLDAARARERLARVGLPPEELDWADAEAVAALAAVATGQGGWHHGPAGWLSPGDWSRGLLARAAQAGQARFVGEAAVARLVRGAGDDGPWQALDAHGRVLAQAPVVVLACAGEATRLLPAGAAVPAWQPVRGQVSWLAADAGGVRAPAVPLAGQGYALRLPDGQLLIGATTQHGDDDPAVRDDDHRHNLARAMALGVLDPAAAHRAEGGRTGWRMVTPDRLPLAGPPVDLAALEAARGTRQRLDAPRHLPRLHDARHGLALLAGLGSRGITSAALAAAVTAAWVTGAPCPVAADLRDAVDPARTARTKKGDH